MKCDFCKKNYGWFSGTLISITCFENMTPNFVDVRICPECEIKFHQPLYNLVKVLYDNYPKDMRDSTDTRS